MRTQPFFRQITLPPFVTPPIPVRATLTFEAVHAETIGPSDHVSVESGRRGTWALRFYPQIDLPRGARIAFRKVENEFRFDYIHQDYWPDARGFVTVEDPQGIAMPFECDTALKSAIPAVVTLPEAWPAERPILVRIGDQRFGGAGVAVRTAVYDSAHIEVGVQLPGDETWHACPNATVAVKVVPCPSIHRVHVWAPSTAKSGDAVRTVALPVDINGNPHPLPDGETATIDVVDEKTRTDILTPMKATGTPALYGNPELVGEGMQRLRFRASSGLTAASNPISVRDGMHIYWGEFHSHGYDAVELNVLNESTHPTKAYRYGRDVTQLDFMAMSSHIFRGEPEAVSDWWELYREAAQACDEPDRYIPFLGCEWRDRVEQGGDRNLLWKDLDAPQPDPTWRIADVYAHLHEQQGMVTPHVGGAIALPYHHNPEVEWLCEMASGHGNFEWFGQAYLQKGYKVGLIGGSDGHNATPGHPRIVAQSGGRFANILRRRDAGWAGGPLLAVRAPALTRDALWEAFRARHVYATTGARAWVDFSIDGVPMGGSLKVDGPVTLRYEAHGTAPIERVTLIRGAYRRQAWQVDALDVSGQLIDEPPPGETYYYLRIEQVDGELIWTSPIWVEGATAGSNQDLPAWNEPVVLDLAAIGENEATPHRADLMHYLRTEERAEAFSDVTPYRVVHAPMGSYAVFLCHVRGRRARIHWFYEFELPRLRMETGWVHYGREQIMNQPWARPLYPNQVML
jgi:hypothetical protein